MPSYSIASSGETVRLWKASAPRAAGSGPWAVVQEGADVEGMGGGDAHAAGVSCLEWNHSCQVLATAGDADDGLISLTAVQNRQLLTKFAHGAVRSSRVARQCAWLNPRAHLH